MKYKTRIVEIFNAWTNRDWDFMESNLAEDFTFMSQYDDHIKTAEFKKKCWDTIEQIGEFEIVTVIENGAEAFVRYKNTINDERVQNAEHLVFDDADKLKSVTVFFGRPD